MSVFYDHIHKRAKKPHGQKVYWRVSAYAVVHQRGKVLMVRPTWNNQWELPGGGIGPEEGIMKGLVRECYEETGYKIKPISYTPVEMSEANFYYVWTKTFFHSLNLYYAARLMSAKQNLAVINKLNPEGVKEIEQVAWLPLGTLKKKNCFPLCWPVIRILKKT